jgi:pyruvate kinase
MEENEKMIKEKGFINEVKVIAKLENEEAIKDIEKILDKADAIMIPRGVLGTVLPIEKISWI